MRPWVKKIGAGVIGAVITVSAMTAPASAETNKITMAEVTAGGGGVDQITFPWTNSGALSQSVMFRALFRAEPNLVTVKGDLAQSYRVSTDGKTVTVVLKSGLKWSDGDALTAEDVIWSINTLLRVASPNAIYTNAFKGIVGGDEVNATNDKTISGLTASGNTITFKLSAPQSTFIPVLAQFIILPKHVLEKEDPLKLATNAFWKNPVTSGPFKVGTFSQGNFITLVPNNQYEGTKPKITEINIIKSANLVADARAGKIDYFFSNDPETIMAMDSVTNFNSNPVSILFYRYFVFNLTSGLFKDVRTRQALQSGVDWNRLVPILYPNLGKVNQGGVLKGQPGYLNTIKDYKYDQKKAIALLKAAKFDFKKTVRLRHYYSDQTSITFMTAIAQQLKALGMKVEMLKFQGDATTELYTNRNYDIALKGLSAFNVGEWYGEYSNSNFEKILGAQPRWAALNEKLVQATTPAARNAALIELQKLEQANLQKMALHTLQQYVFVSKRISGANKFGNPLYIYDNNFVNWTAR